MPQKRQPSIWDEVDQAIAPAAPAAAAPSVWDDVDQALASAPQPTIGQRQVPAGMNAGGTMTGPATVTTPRPGPSFEEVAAANTKGIDVGPASVLDRLGHKSQPLNPTEPQEPLRRSRTGQMYRSTPMGTMPILDAPHVGAQQIAKGAGELLSAATDTAPVPVSTEPLRRSRTGALYQPPPPIDERTKAGVGDILEGGMTATEPLVAGMGLASPLPVASTLVKAAVASKATESVLTRLGVDPGNTRVAADVVGALAAGVPLEGMAREAVRKGGEWGRAKQMESVPWAPGQGPRAAERALTPEVPELPAAGEPGIPSPTGSSPVGAPSAPIPVTPRAPEPSPVWDAVDQAIAQTPTPPADQGPPIVLPPVAVRPGGTAGAPVAPSPELPPVAPSAETSPVWQAVDEAIAQPTDTSGRELGGYAGPERRTENRVSSPEEDARYTRMREKLAAGEPTGTEESRQVLAEKQRVEDYREQAAVDEVKGMERPQHLPRSRWQPQWRPDSEYNRYEDEESGDAPAALDATIEEQIGRLTEIASLEDQLDAPAKRSTKARTTQNAKTEKKIAELRDQYEGMWDELASNMTGVDVDEVRTHVEESAKRHLLERAGQARLPVDVWKDVDAAVAATPAAPKSAVPVAPKAEKPQQPAKSRPANTSQAGSVEHTALQSLTAALRSADRQAAGDHSQGTVYVGNYNRRLYEDAAKKFTPEQRARVEARAREIIDAEYAREGKPKVEPETSIPVTPKSPEKYDAAARGKAYEDMTEAELKELLDIGVADEPQKAATELSRRSSERMALLTTQNRTPEQQARLEELSPIIAAVRARDEQRDRGQSIPVTPKAQDDLSQLSKSDLHRLTAGGTREQVTRATEELARRDMATNAEGHVFKVGDRVVLSDGDDTRVHTIKAIHSNGIRIEYEEGNGRAVTPAQISPAPEKRKTHVPPGIDYNQMTEAELRQLVKTGTHDQHMAARDELAGRIKAKSSSTPVTPKTVSVYQVPDGYRLQDVSKVEDAEEARIKGGKFTIVAQQVSPFRSERGYGDTPDAARADALRRLGAFDEKAPLPVTPKEAEPEPRSATTPITDKNEPGKLATTLYAVFRDNVDKIPKDPRELRKFASRVTGRTEADIADHIDELNDAVEAVLAQQIAPSTPGSALNPDDKIPLSAALADAHAVEAKLPRAHRSLEKTKLQQFSTPLPISVIAAHAAQITKVDTVVEPTAGTGNLLAAIVPRELGGPQVLAMELSPRRAALLKAQGYHVTVGDYLATKTPVTPTVIITNPPWGKYSTGKYGRGVALGFPPSDVAERFVAKNMRDLADGGRLVAVMPTTMLDAPNFRKWLNDNFTVRAIVKSPPGSYDTRATSVDSVLLVVDKTKAGARTLPKVFAANDWQEYISAVEAIHERSTTRATEGRPAEAPQPAPKRGSERVSGQPRPAAPKSGRDAAVGTGRPADVVAEGPAEGRRQPVEPAGAPASAAAPPDGTPPAKVSGPSNDTRREAAGSRFFAPYVRRSTVGGQPHPKLLVEAKQLAGVPYPKLTAKPTPSMTKALDAGRVSVEQAEQALAVLQANSGEKPFGYLAADAVGVGKSREIAMTLLGAMDRAKAAKRPLRLMLTTKSRDNVEDLLDEIHFVASGKPAAQGGTVPFEIFRLADDYPGAKKSGNDYEPLPKAERAIYVVDSYNVAPYRQALVDVDLHGVVGDEVQRFSNQDAQIGGAWLNIHARVMRNVARPEQFFAYFTATPAQKVEDYRYLYGLRLWPVDGFADWLELVTGSMDEKKAKELADATERGSIKPIDDILKDTDTVSVGGDSEDGSGKSGKPKKSWQTYASNVFAQRLTPAEGEQIPREWKILGRFSARDLWRKGTTFDIHEFKLTGEQKKRYNQFVELARDIVVTAQKYGLYDKSGKSSRFGVTGSLQFAAKRIQMQPALEEAVRLSKQLAADGYQPVLSIINVSEMSADKGHLIAAVEKINTRMVDADPDDPEAGLTDLGEIPEAVIDRARLMDRIRDLGSFGDPVEYIAEELGQDKVAFIIGKEKSSRRKASAEFQSGTRQYAVISGAGSTGINLDQRIKTAQGPGHGRRVFLDVQYEWSAMESVQRYGRVDRASSIAPPKLIALTSGNAAEKKFLATIANRMAALGALSKGGAESTGAAGNALEEFEITGDDALAAARRAYEEADDDTKRSFATIKSAFRDPNRNGTNPDHADFDPFKPRRDAHGVGMIDFQLPLLLMPMDEANAFWSKFVQYRDELRASSGERETMRSTRFSGQVLETHPLKEHLKLYAVKNDQGKKFGILAGLITPEMPTLRTLLRGAKHDEVEGGDYTSTADVTFRRRYVTFTSGDDIITGLQVPYTRIAHVAEHYGAAVHREKLDTPEKVLAYLRAGETITLGVTNPDSGKPWVLRLRSSDARIVIENARMADRSQLLNNGGDYVPVGNYWRVKDLAKFLERWPVPDQGVATAKPKASSASSGGIQSAVIPGMKEFVEQDVTPALKAAGEEVDAARKDLRALFAPDTVSAASRLFADDMRANMAAHTQRVQRAQRVLAKLEKAFDGRADDANLRFMDAIESGRIDSLPPGLKAAAAQLRDLLAHKRNEVRKRGRLKSYIENYFPHEWKQPSKAKQIISQILGRRPLQGPKSFLKKRTIPTVAEGVKLGLEPTSYNPVTLVLHKLAEMDKWIMAHDVLSDAKEHGVAQFVRVGGKAPEGWQRYHESFGTVYGKPTVPIKEMYDAKLMDALYDFAHSLGVRTVRKVRVGGQRWGYAVGASDIVTKFAGPEGVLMHEIGHILDEQFGMRRKWVNNPDMRKELRELADLRFEGTRKEDLPISRLRYYRKGEEKIANLVHAFIYAPDRAKKVAPNTYWALYNLAKETPQLKPLIALQKARSLTMSVNVAEVPVGGMVVKGHYYGPPEATRLLNNYLSPGLRGNVAFDLYRRAGNFMNQVQLGLSAFHLTMTGLEAVVSKAAQTLQETSRGVAALSRGDIPVAGRELGHAAKSAAQTPVATFLDLFRGHQALKAFYAQDANARLVASVADTIIQAGGGVGWDKLHHDDLPKKFMTALRQGNYIGAAWRTVPMAFEAMSKPIMEWWVPRLKLGAFLDLARMELRTLGPEPSVTEVRRVLGDVWDSIDNRFGELRYDNLFWHNALKDLGMGSVRALGWNVGTVREVFGAPSRQFKQLRDRPRRIRNTGRDEEGRRTFTEDADPWLTHKFAYTIAMVFTYGVIGALYQYFHTGEHPSTLRDYFFPKTGHKKPDGTEERVSIPGYFKDAYAVLHDFPASAVTTAGHKMHPFLNAMLEMFQNEDYFGTEIRNPEDPSVQQLRQIFDYLGEQFTPISLRNYDRRRESLSGTGISGVESLFGISEAPASVTRSKAEQLIRRYMPPSTHTRLQAEQMQERQRIREGLKAGTPEGRAQAQAAIQRGTLSQGSVLNTLRTAQASSLQRGFQTLTLDQALKVYEVATEDERAELRTMLERKAQNVENAAPRDREDLMRRLREAGKLPFTRKGQIPVTAR